MGWQLLSTARFSVHAWWPPWAHSREYPPPAPSSLGSLRALLPSLSAWVPSSPVSQHPGGNPRTLGIHGGQGRPRADASAESTRPLGAVAPALTPRMGHADPSNNGMAAPVGTRVQGAPPTPCSLLCLGRSAAHSHHRPQGPGKSPSGSCPWACRPGRGCCPSGRCCTARRWSRGWGMLLERVIRGVAVAVGLTARRKRGGSRVRVMLGTWHQDGEAGLGAIHESCDAVRKQGLRPQSREGPGKAKRQVDAGKTWTPAPR